MPYLAKSDYTLSISVSDLDEIVDAAAEASGLTADQVRGNAEAWSKAFIKSLLSTKYDIAAEFSKNSPDTTRDLLVLGVLVDLTLCQLLKTIDPRDIPELREKACVSAVQWLKDVRDGKAQCELTPKTPAEGETIYNRSHIGSQRKFISRPYEDRLVIGEDDE